MQWIVDHAIANYCWLLCTDKGNSYCVVWRSAIAVIIYMLQLHCIATARYANRGIPPPVHPLNAGLHKLAFIVKAHKYFQHKRVLLCNTISDASSQKIFTGEEKFHRVPNLISDAPRCQHQIRSHSPNLLKHGLILSFEHLSRDC